MYNYNNGHLPRSFDNMFQKNLCVHSYGTQQSNLFHQPIVRTTVVLNSICIRGLKAWNGLESSIKSSSTLSRFKKLCKEMLFKQVQMSVAKTSNYYSDHLK